MTDPEKEQALESATQRRQLVSEIDSAIYWGGAQMARRVASGQIAVPAAFAQWALCTDTQDQCAPLPAFATRDLNGPRPQGPQTPIAVMLFPDTQIDDATAHPCEIAARAAVLRVPLTPTDKMEACLHGALGFDFKALFDEPGDNAADLIARYTTQGITPLSIRTIPRVLPVLLGSGLSGLDFGEMSTTFENAARLALEMEHSSMAFDFLLLRILTEIVDPKNTSLSYEARQSAKAVGAYLRDEEIGQMLSRLHIEGALITDADKKRADAAAVKILRPN